MKVISFGATSLRYTYPIISSILYVLRSYVFDFFKGENKFDCPLVLKIQLMFFGMILSVIFEIITMCRQTKDKNCSFEFKERLYKYKSQLLIIFLFGLLSSLDLFGFFFLSLLSFIDGFEDNYYLLSITRITEFFFVCVLNYLFLRVSLHRHHYLSLVSIILGLVCIILGQELTFSILFIYALVGNVLYAFLEIIEKWVMDYKFFSAFELPFFEGLFGLIFSIIISIISSSINCRDWMIFCKTGERIFNYSSVKSIFQNGLFFLQVFMFIVLTTGYNIFIGLTNKHFGPTHRVIADTFSSIITMAISMVMSSQWISIFLQIFGNLLITIGIIIYNEIIIIHVLKLDHNTNKVIKDRASFKEKPDNAFYYQLPMKKSETSE